MPHKDGNPTLGEQLEEDARRRFYTDEILAEARQDASEIKTLRAENERLRAALSEDHDLFLGLHHGANARARVALEAAMARITAVLGPSDERTSDEK